MLKAVASNIFFIVGTRLGREIEKIFTQHREQKQVIVTEEILQKLPNPVKRYLKYTGGGWQADSTNDKAQAGRKNPEGCYTTMDEF